MKKAIVLSGVLALSALVAKAADQVDFNAYKSCIVTYVRVQSDNSPNLVTSCDGGAGYLAQTMPYFKSASDYEGFKYSVRAEFEALVNKNHTKTCEEHETPEVWYKACYVK